MKGRMKHCKACAAITRGTICSDCKRLLRKPRDPDYPWMFRRIAYLYNHGAGPKLDVIEAEGLTHLLAGHVTRAAEREASPAFHELMETALTAAASAAPQEANRLNAVVATA